MPNNTNLREVVTEMGTRWINNYCKGIGLPQGFIFGWANEVNDIHNKDLPFMVVNPPSTTTSLSEMQHDMAKQSMNFTIQIYDFEPSTITPITGYTQMAGNWDSIEDCFYKWLLSVLYNLTYKVTLGDGSLNMTRTKMAGNDSMFMLECTFTLSVFRTCFEHNDTTPQPPD